MSKSVVTIIFIALLIGVYFLVDNIKKSYEILPIKESPTMQVGHFDNWGEFTSHVKGFKVSLPSYPQHAKQAVSIPKTDKKRLYEMYASEELDGSVFMVSVITYPTGFMLSSPNDDSLQEIVEEMMQTNANNHLEKLEHTDFRKYPALDFVILNNEFKIYGKVFMEGNTAYLLTHVAKKENFSMDEYNHFINSFQLVEVTKGEDSQRKDSEAEKNRIQVMSSSFFAPLVLFS